MTTFLVQKKMHPALAARIEASVRGENDRRTRERGARRGTAIARVMVLAAALVTGRACLSLRARETSELDASRNALVTDVRAKAAALGDGGREVVARVLPILARSAASPSPDLVAPEVAGSGLGAVLARPAIYVRGPTSAFVDEQTTLAAARASRKDPFVVCLVDPPASSDEKAILDHTRAVYMGGGEARTRTVSHLSDAMLGLPYLAESFVEKARTAKTVQEVGALRRSFEKAPTDAAITASRAEIVIAAIDEPGTGGGPTELDGERAHEVRVIVTELRTGRDLLRLRRPVDPAWMSSTARVVYASGMDGCRLALDVRKAVAAASPKAP